MWRRQQHALLGFLLLPPVKPGARSPAAWAGGGLGRRYGSTSAPERRKGKAAPLQARGMVDRFRLRARGGDGGNGCVSIRRSRSDRQGRPDGGNGGKGGDVILECSRSIWDFSGLQHHMIAQVPLCQGEHPSVAVNKPTRALDPWEIPDAVGHSASSLNQVEHMTMKGSGHRLSHQHIAPKDNTEHHHHAEGAVPPHGAIPHGLATPAHGAVPPHGAAPPPCLRL